MDEDSIKIEMTHYIVQVEDTRRRFLVPGAILIAAAYYAHRTVPAVRELTNEIRKSFEDGLEKVKSETEPKDKTGEPTQ